MNPREILTELHAAAIAAVNPRRAVLAHMSRQGDTLTIDGEDIDLSQIKRIYVIGGGKASAPMAAAVEELLGERITAGFVVVKDGHTCELQHITLHEASHPVPDERGAAGAARILELLEDLDAKDLVINCLSGGASALLPAPRAPMTLADKQALTDALLASGADIHALNCLRRHVSRIKGGNLAKAAAPARLVNLIISDVVGDDLNAIGSGPGVPDASTLADAQAYFDTHLAERSDLPASIQTVLQDPASETAKASEACFQSCSNCLVATNAQAQAAIVEAAHHHHIRVERETRLLTGDALEEALAFVQRARALADRLEAGSKPVLLLVGGETTVVLPDNPGKGGRCQSFALAAAEALQDDERICIMAAGTDGNDGPTDASGAFADKQLWPKAQALGLDPLEARRIKDEYPLLKACDALLITGPTNTNVMDLYAALITP